MRQVICLHPYIPIRLDPKHRSEQVSQLLFGETAFVTQTSDEWYQIKTLFDDYTGWVEILAVTTVNPDDLTDHNTIVCSPFQRVMHNNYDLYLPCGSILPDSVARKRHFTLCGREYSAKHIKTSEHNPTALAQQFMHTPYLWGGRTVMGIDCSGLVQVVFKACGIALPRDACQQINFGEPIASLDEAAKGDLCFFHNEAGKITHVGIYLGDGHIIHASKSVRMDRIDTHGIYNEELESYTHVLNSVRRVQKK